MAQKLQSGAIDRLSEFLLPGNLLWTCDPVIIKQLFTLPNVQVPVKMLKLYDIWGPTIGSVEGEEWKTHRKVVTYGLNPSTQLSVWKESIHQTRTLIDRWADDGSVLTVAKYWTSRLALHVIASIFFDMKLDWREYTAQDKASNLLSECGCRISFESALFTVLARMGLIFMVPRFLLRTLPFKACQEAHIALTDWTKYMQNLRQKAAEKIDRLATKKGKTILESIVLAGTPTSSSPNTRPLSEESMLGNIWFTLMAGHETAGNTLAFALLLLAIYPEHQLAIQKQLDAQLGSRPSDEWSMEQDFPALQKGHLGAVLKEVLRTYNVIQFFFRLVAAATTMVDSSGQKHDVPTNTLCALNYAAAFQNPATWAPKNVSEARRAELHHSPAIDFDPSRWLDESVKDEDLIFFPFGNGPRKCPGMPFAQVEMVAVLATLFKECSLELMVTEDLVQTCNGDRNMAWEKTRDEAIRRMKDDVGANLTIQMLKELPILLLKRK
ncbi:cytochrome P450 [Clohesyomyces aquaticus]|uniref:Cytochrome P450 n=1 Tax=Clohesyomyces aquaticus TaxID=1231657 RepID=A0A1Y1ZEL4_9PLEO|nr:cytochrome P450 [Clohesyomyces aquaticus]